MASSYTPILRLTLPATGELQGTWGDTVNNGITSLTEAAIAGTAAVVMSDADHTLTVANGATDEARRMFVTLTGALTATRNVICPAVSKMYVVRNNTTGGQSIVFKTSAGTGITVANGQSAFLYCDGTNVVEAFSAFAGNAGSATVLQTARTLWGQNFNGSANVTGALSGVTDIAASGNVTLNGGTANGVAYLNGSKVLTTGSALTFDGTRLTSVTGKFGSGAAVNSASLMVNNATNTATGIQLFQDGIESWIMGMPANSAGLAWSASGSEQMRLTSTGLGIGTSSPSQKLHVVGTGQFNALQIGANNTDINQSTSNPIVFKLLGNESMRLDASGNLGLGTISPGAKLDVAGDVRSERWIGRINTSPPTADAFIYRPADNSLGFGTANTERMRLDSSGNLLVGTTSNSTPVSGFTAEVSAGGSGVYTRINIGHSSSASIGEAFSRFLFNSSVIGSITRNGASSVAYNTSSDYRLKNTIAPMTGALAKVALLKPCTYKWNADGSDGEGFIAHELAEVCPQAVTGEKDAVDADGNPVYQGIDTGFLVATLTAAIQELKAIVDAQAERIAQLEQK